MVISGLVVLTRLQTSNPGVPHLKQERYYWIAKYTPSLVGTITTIIVRAVWQSYYRIIPYIAMAGMSNLGGKTHFVMTSYSSMYPVDLISDRHWLALSLWMLLGVVTFTIPPLKTWFMQVVQDDTGWGVEVSTGVGHFLIGLYSIIAFLTAGMICRLAGKPTGLRWNPSSLAARISLLQDSNLSNLRACEGLESDKPREFRLWIREWTRHYGGMRLGYWRHKRDHSIIHCIRFIKQPDGNIQFPQTYTTPQPRTCLQSDMLCSSPDHVGTRIVTRTGDRGPSKSLLHEKGGRKRIS